MKKKHELLKFAYDNYPKGSLARFKTAPNVDHVSTGKFRIIEGTGNGTCVVSEEDNACFYGSDTDEWAEIVKPKVAVLVTTEKEVNAICKFKGWSYPVTAWLGKCDCVVYLDEPFLEYNKLSEHNEQELENYNLIPFAEFAKEHRIKLPLITTLDGHDLLDGDYYIVVSNNKENWQIFTCSEIIKNYSKVISEPDNYKAFHDKQNALSWIEAQKPKIIKIDLYFGLNAHIFNETGEVHIFCKDNLLARLSTGDILDIKSSIQ